MIFSFLILYIYYNKIFIKNQIWGEGRDSNPQHSESQSDALPLRYQHHIEEEIDSVGYINSTPQVPSVHTVYLAPISLVSQGRIELTRPRFSV